MFPLNLAKVKMGEGNLSIHYTLVLPVHSRLPFGGETMFPGQERMPGPSILG